MADEETTLVERAADGDVEALKTLLARHGPAVWTTVNAEIGTQWRSLLDADDVMQVTYLEAFLQIGRMTGRDGDAFASWLRRVAINNLRDAVKELGRKKRPNPAHRVHATAGEDSYVTLVDRLAAPGATPSRQVARDEAVAVIDATLQRLPPDYATVLRLYDLDGHEIAQVAAAMGRSTGAIHMLRARAHDHLRLQLTSETDFFTNTA